MSFPVLAAEKKVDRSARLKIDDSYRKRRIKYAAHENQLERAI